MSKLKIGDGLFRYTGVSIMSYEVIEVIKSKGGTSYKLNCNDCKDHRVCEILVAHNKKGEIIYLETVNNDDEEYWHNDRGEFQGYEFTKNKAVANRTQWTIGVVEEQIQKSESSIQFNKAKLAELKATLEALSELTPPTAIKKIGE